METAKEMTRESLPIKCLEAVILGMYPLRFALSLCVPLLELVVLWCPWRKNVRCPLHLTWLELNTPKLWLLGPASSNLLSVMLSGTDARLVTVDSAVTGEFRFRGTLESACVAFLALI